MTSWPDIPEDAIEWFRSVFYEANRKASEILINQPNVRETTLDDQLILSLIPVSSPRLLPSGAVVKMNIHNIGGLRRVHQWETADIAILVFVQRGTRIVAQKIGLLQSKRLYPANNDVDDEDPVGFQYGMNAFLNPQPTAMAAINRRFEFNEDCIYGALKNGDRQLEIIDRFNKEFGPSIFYLFYNPAEVPSVTDYPVSYYKAIQTLSLGCRVARSNSVHKLVRTLSKGRSPTLQDIADATTSRSAWSLEHWV